MRRPSICIAHQSVMPGDAIGHDMLGAYRLLTRCGYSVTILCEYAHPDVASRHRVLMSPSLASEATGFDLLIYHHSQHWPDGEQLLERFPGAIVVKYHNITPAEFFAPYTDLYRAKCADGREQTARMLGVAGIVRWQADSLYNCRELESLGVPPDRSSVVPPFNRVDEVFRQSRDASYGMGEPVTVFFAGRRAPNKGHTHLLRTVAAWRDLFPERELRCQIVGATDAQLAKYYQELAALQVELRLQGRIDWLEHVSDARLTDCFRTAHIYLNLSEHEGFCVPMVEAQAIGLPVISTDAAALAETAGPDQLCVSIPKSQEDYDLIAGLVHEVCASAGLRESLVEAGCRNAYERFTSQPLETRFLNALTPVLEAIEG